MTEDLEFYSVMRSIRAIEESDVCILMLDAQQGLESQDLNIHNLIVRNRKGCVIVVNKWDLVEKGNNTMKEWKEALAKKLAPFNDIPIIFTSVLNKQRILEVLQTAIRVYENRKRRVATSALNDYLLPIIENYRPGDQRQIHQNQIRRCSCRHPRPSSPASSICPNISRIPTAASWRIRFGRNGISREYRSRSISDKNRDHRISSTPYSGIRRRTHKE